MEIIALNAPNIILDVLTPESRIPQRINQIPCFRHEINHINHWKSIHSATSLPESLITIFSSAAA